MSKNVPNNPSPMVILQADALFGDANQVAIAHAGEAYVLSKTRQNKLLLTKLAGASNTVHPQVSTPNNQQQG